MSEKQLIIGIDTGRYTGFAAWDPEAKNLFILKTLKIHVAVLLIEQLYRTNRLYIRVEDARQRKWFGNSGREKLQGAGSVKRDCVIWDDYLSELKKKGLIDGFEMVAPRKNKTKLSEDAFKSITKYTGQTSKHSRDAAMLVFSYKSINVNI